MLITKHRFLPYAFYSPPATQTYLRPLTERIIFCQRIPSTSTQKIRPRCNRTRISFLTQNPALRDYLDIPVRLLHFGKSVRLRKMNISVPRHQVQTDSSRPHLHQVTPISIHGDGIPVNNNFTPVFKFLHLAPTIRLARNASIFAGLAINFIKLQM